MMMEMKINPPGLCSKSYEFYKLQLLAWREVTDICKTKQGIVIALSLPENEEFQIKEKVFSQVSLDDLKKEDGLDILIQFLDKHLKKDDLTDSIEKFEEFDDCQRAEGQSITEFIDSFDSKYRRIEKLNMKMPSEILAFKLIRKANISREEKLLVLTGLDYERRETLYEDAKKSLRKFLGDVHKGSKHLVSGDKCQGSKILAVGDDLERECLKKQEEALLAAGYVEQSRMNRTRNFNRCGYNGQTSGMSLIRKKKNPVGSNGRPLTCRSCGSYRHLVRECPDSWENMSQINTSMEEEHMVLFTGNNLGDWQQDMDLGNCALLDSACSSTVCGKKWLDNYIDSLDQSDKRNIQQTGSRRMFVFGGGNKLRSDGEFCLPAEIAGKEVRIKTDVVQSDIPLLLSRKSMKTAGVKMDLENDTATIFGKEVTLNLTASGHYSVLINRSRKELVTKELNTRKEAAINKCNPQQEKQKIALNDKVLCNMNLEDNHEKIDRQGQLTKGGDFDCEIDKQLKNEKYTRSVCVKQNCEAGGKDLNCQGEKKLWLDPCMRIFEDNEDFVVRKRAMISFNNELKFQGFKKCREKEINVKLKTDIFSSDSDCMRSKMEFMQIRKGLVREKEKNVKNYYDNGNKTQ